ncbi:hypothetical protein ACFL4F_03480 [Candidatus Margulisiibacteriota bacterium]
MKNNRVIINKELGIKLELIPGWSWRYDQIDKVVLKGGPIFIYPDDDSYMSLTVSKAEKSLPNIMTGLKAKLAATNIPLKSAQEKIGEREFTTCELTVTEDDMPMKIRAYYIQGKKGLLCFTLAAHSLLFDEAVAACVKVLEKLLV